MVLGQKGLQDGAGHHHCCQYHLEYQQQPDNDLHHGTRQSWRYYDPVSKVEHPVSQGSCDSNNGICTNGTWYSSWIVWPINNENGIP